MNRRQILQSFSTLILGGAATRSFAFNGPNGTGFTAKLGAQTNAWAIDPENFDSFLAVLEQIKQIGYAGFETGFFNLVHELNMPGDVAQKIVQTGLQFTGIHVAIGFDKTDPATKLPPASLYEKVARGGLKLGAQRLVFSGSPAANEEELKRKIEGLNTAGRFARSLGLPFSYHNHWWEVQSKVNELESLYERTDPAEVSFILDAGHAYHGGLDVPGFIRRHGSRIATLHLKDFKDGKAVPLGEGGLPLKEIVALLEAVHWSGWLINEEDRTDGSKLGTPIMERANRVLREPLPTQVRPQ